jgi:hydroxymethylpyrimidine/phosphomethylpyrimidine kinase
LKQSPKRLLIIAGSDSGGGAGIQADIKTATALGVYSMTAITAVTVQDTVRVHAIHPVPAFIVRDQITCVLEDIGADAIKIGMLGSRETVEAVANVLGHYARIPIVLDPVLASTSGTPLIEPEAIETLKQRLLPLVVLVTPNYVELGMLATHRGHPDDLLDLGAGAVLVKGGHGSDDPVTDFFHTRKHMLSFERRRIKTSSTHGTGCTLATAIACGLAKDRSLPEAIEDARNYLQTAIATAPGFGRGHGPLNHMHPLNGDA